ncbi:hypothetical protein JXM67_13600 [candidate division WOR-3 bacterium]|nr:hypothetical protein [candidate division WOR-3 bacterium]
MGDEAVGSMFEWKIEPHLWESNRGDRFSAGAINFTVTGDSIRAECKGTGVESVIFLDKAFKIAEIIVDSYILDRGHFFQVVGLIEKYQKAKSAPPTVIEKPEGEKAPTRRYVSIGATDIEGDVYVIDRRGDSGSIQDTFRYALSDKGLTLRAAMGYYRLALSGLDQLAIAGNLYMAMEVLIRKFGGEGETAEALKVSKRKFKNIKMWLDRGRHVPRKGLSDLTVERLQICKREVREYILAYVE